MPECVVTHTSEPVSAPSHPYPAGEGVGRREDTHAGAHEGKAEGPAGGGGPASSAEGMESEGPDVGDLE